MKRAAQTSAKSRLATQMRSRRVSPIMAAALAALTTSAVAAGLYAAGAFLPFGKGEPQAAKSEWRPPSLAAFEPPASKPAAADVATLARPLFSRSRRPEPGGASAASSARLTDPAGAGPPLTLAGIVLHGASGRAFVMASNGVEGEWYGVGERVAGWMVSEIRRLDLTLKSGGRSAELKLYPESGEVETDAAAAPLRSPPPHRRVLPPKQRRRG